MNTKTEQLAIGAMTAGFTYATQRPGDGSAFFRPRTTPGSASRGPTV